MSAVSPADPAGRPTRVVRHRDADTVLEMVFAPSDRRLHAIAPEYCGYRERSARPMRRRELPWPGIVLIFDFGPTAQFLDPRNGTVAARHPGGFVAGLHDMSVLMASDGAQSGLHANLTPLGARRLLGLPMSELANRVIGIEDAFGPAGKALAARLRDTPGWPARFDLLDAALLRRLAETEAPAGIAVAGWRRLQETGGRIPIGALAAELDCSRRHLIAVFRDQIGLPPKTVARVLRFHRAIALYDRGACAGWADVAYECGYSDQAHFVNDFRHFAGVSPTAFLARRRPLEHATLPA